MADYISREAAISKILSEPTDAHYPSWYAEKLKQIPTADVRPVVYCKDCKHSDTFSPDCTEATFPLKCLSVRYGGVFPLWFCEHGERKGGADMRKVVEIDQVKEGAE